MKNFLRKWLGIAELDREVGRISQQLTALSLAKPKCEYNDTDRRHMVWLVQTVDSLLEELGYETKRTLIHDPSYGPPDERVREIATVSKKKKKPNN